MLEFLNGKKTYIIALVAAITAGLQALGYAIPDWAYAIEGALGIASTRAAIAKSAP